MRRSLILDFDASVVGLAEASVIPLRELQESIRFACSLRQLQALMDGIEQPLDDNSGVVLLGSGDFHHVSFALIERVARFRPVEVIVLDNHPDNMRWLGGIHCGSWVRHVARLRNVIHVHVLGITSPDISAAQLWENYFTPLLRGRLTYWSVGQKLGWMHRLRWHEAFRNFATPAELCAAFAREQRNAAHPVYLSIDKDVLSPTLVACNWDQGCFTEQHIDSILQTVQGRVIASDITARSPTIATARTGSAGSVRVMRNQRWIPAVWCASRIGIEA